MSIRLYLFRGSDRIYVSKSYFSREFTYDNGAFSNTYDYGSEGWPSFRVKKDGIMGANEKTSSTTSDVV